MAGATDATALIQELSTLSASDLLDDPIDTATQLVFSPYIAIAARIAVELELFTLIQNDPEQAATTAALAQATQAEPLLISRILRLLAGVGFVAEVGPSAWASTPVTAAMASPPVAAGHRFVGDVLMTSAAVAPRYLREARYRCPTEPTDGFIQFAQQTKLDVFAYLTERPRLLADFHQFMGHTMGSKEYWIDWYPVSTRLLAGADRDTALLVDIGGGRGHDLQAFHNKYPGSGRLVLQIVGYRTDGKAESFCSKNPYNEFCFTEMTDSRPMPTTEIKYAGNWFYSALGGTLAMSRALFWDRFLVDKIKAAHIAAARKAGEIFGKTQSRNYGNSWLLDDSPPSSSAMCGSYTGSTSFGSLAFGTSYTSGDVTHWNRDQSDYHYFSRPRGSVHTIARPVIRKGEIEIRQSIKLNWEEGRPIHGVDELVH